MYTTINEKSSLEFENENKKVYVKVWEKKEEGNDVIIF